MSAASTDNDFTLIVDNEEIFCSREALQKCSEYFQAMFCSNMRETTASSVVIKDVSLHCMQWLVNYSKDKSRHKFEDVYDACEILHTACILQCLEVIDIASKYIIARLSTENCLGIMCLADLHALNHLYNVSRRKALWDFVLVRSTPEFFSRDKDTIVGYLSCGMLNSPSEELVLKAAVQWIEYDLDQRKEMFHEVLSCVRLADVGCSQLKPYLLQSCVVNDEKAHHTLSKAVELELVPKKSRRPLHQLWVTGELHPTPQAVQSNSKLVCVHGGLDQTTGKFELLDNLPINNPHPRGNGRATERAGFTVTVVGKDLYILGGGSVSSSQLHPDCWRYDTFRGVWTDVGDLPIPRRHHSTVLVAGRYLMLVGGFGKHRVMLDSVLCYDTVTGEWSEQPKLNSAVYSAAVCECQDHIYVFKHQIQRLSVKPLDTGENQWQELRLGLPFEIGLYSAVSVGEKIYILGKNICSLVCFDTRSLTFDTLATFQPYVQRDAPVLCLKDPQELLIISLQKRDDEGVRTVVEEFDIKEKRVLKHYDLGWIINNPQVASVPYYPNFR